jgi:hypothetical protein
MSAVTAEAPAPRDPVTERILKGAPGPTPSAETRKKTAKSSPKPDNPKPAKPKESKPKPSAAEQQAALVGIAEKIAKSTRIQNLTVEPRQSGKVAVIVITDDAGARILAYVRHPKQDQFASVEVAHYGRYERGVYEDVKSAAAAVKTSERRKPRVKAETGEKLKS